MHHRLFARLNFTPLLILFLLTGCGEGDVSKSLKRAQTELDAGKNVQALARLEVLHKKHPADTSVTEALAFAELNAGDATSAGALFNELGLKTSPDNHLYAAQAFKKAQEPAKAAEAYRLYLLAEPEQAEPWRELGELLIASGAREEGLKALAKAGEIELTPELAERLGTLYAEEGNNPQAQRYLQNALRLSRTSRENGQAASPTEERALEKLASLAIEQKKSSEAQRHLKQLERDFPKNENLKNLEERLAHIGETKEAPAKTKRTEATPRAASKRLTENIADTPVVVMTTNEKGNSVIAAAADNVIVEAPRLLEPLAKVEAPKQTGRAEQLLAELQKDTSNADAWAKFAAAKASEGELAWAESAFLESLRLRPSDAPTIIAYVDVVRQRRSPKEALEETEAQITKNPETPSLYLLAARGYRDWVQNKRNASIVFGKFLKKFPNHPDTAKVQAELDALK